MKMFSGQSLEKTMDLTRRAFMLKSNKHDPEADVLKYDRRQSMLSKRERKPRSYVKHDTEYWSNKKHKTVNETPASYHTAVFVNTSETLCS